MDGQVCLQSRQALYSLLSILRGWVTVHRMWTKMRPLWQQHLVMQRIRRLYWRICESQWFWAGGQVVVVGFCTSVELTSCLCPCLWIMPYEPSLARALVAHERAVRRGPDPV